VRTPPRVGRGRDDRRRGRLPESLRLDGDELASLEGLDDLNNVARSTEQSITTLSGGNQQRCVLGKWLAALAHARRVDLRHRRQRQGRPPDHRPDRCPGVAVRMISSELPEVIGRSDRIYVMRDGGVAVEIADRPGMSQERFVDYICQGERVRGAAGVPKPCAEARRRCGSPLALMGGRNRSQHERDSPHRRDIDRWR